MHLIYKLEKEINSEKLHQIYYEMMVCFHENFDIGKILIEFFFNFIKSY